MGRKPKPDLKDKFAVELLKRGYHIKYECDHTRIKVFRPLDGGAWSKSITVTSGNHPEYAVEIKVYDTTWHRIGLEQCLNIMDDLEKANYFGEEQ